MSALPKKANGTPPPIGEKLKAARQTRKMTLERLSVLSGVSKSMLSQVERGETNPSFALLWNLTQALGVEISELVGGAAAELKGQGEISLMPQHGTPTIRSADGLCTLLILSPADKAGTCEWYHLTIAPGGALDSRAHAKGTREHLTVFSGQVTVTSGGADAKASKGETLRYEADVAHAIRNPGKTKAEALLVVDYASN